VVKQVGKGSFAEVFLATNKKTGVAEVIKRIQTDRFSGDQKIMSMI
jgi:serine/threonine protein kinase